MSDNGAEDRTSSTSAPLPLGQTRPTWERRIRLHTYHLKRCIEIENFSYLYASQALNVNSRIGISDASDSESEQATCLAIKAVLLLDVEEKEKIHQEFADRINKIGHGGKNMWKAFLAVSKVNRTSFMEKYAAEHDAVKKRAVAGTEKTLENAVRLISSFASSEREAAAETFIAGTGVLGDVSAQLVNKSRDVVESLEAILNEKARYSARPVTFSAVPATRVILNFLGSAVLATGL